MEQSQSFDRIADIYARVRRGYPAPLYEDLVRHAGLSEAARVLEVGCGAGQATGDLARRAREVVAIDPGARLLAEARKAVQAENVNFVVSSFEGYADAPGDFGLIASAQAWHWVDPAVGLPKAARLLAADGSLAIFGHVPMLATGPVVEQMKRAFDRHAPGVWGAPPPQAAYLPSGPYAAMIEGSGLFGPVQHFGYAWIWSLDAETIGQYLRTDSSYHAFPEPLRLALFDEMVAAVQAVGGRFEWPWETHMYVARRRR